MLKSCAFLFAAFLGFAVSPFAWAAENCTFSEEGIHEQPLAGHDAIAIVTRFPESNEVKGVLSNGNLFSVKYWSCTHYGRQAIMVIGPQPKVIPDRLNDHVMSLAKVALGEPERTLLASSIEARPLELTSLPTTLRVPSNAFDEFYVRIHVVDELILVEIKLYKS